MPGTSFIQSAASYCHKLTTRSNSNFYYAFLFLTREKREALEAVYAFCRLVDDVVDEPGSSAAEKLTGLERWRREVARVYSDAQTEDPVVQRLRVAVRKFAIRRQDLDGVIDG